jgi:bifunctional non-homologous end joining protein LigD
MSLSLYNKKRNFTETPEPAGKEKTSKTSLRFVIQKHDASSVHYDFRLEMEGVLKSWAVPKGPSSNTADKRLAMMVEDHPYDYRNFEGVIPEGNYGAGTVIVWDEGFYEPETNSRLSKKEQEKQLLQQLYAGSLRIVLHGKKLKGVYTLRQLRKGEEKPWLLIKGKDEYATTEDITEQEQSVRSGKTLSQVAADNGTVLNHPAENVVATDKRKTKPVNTTSGKNAEIIKKQSAGKKVRSAGINALLKPFENSIQKSAIPKNIKPMLATLVDEPFNDPNWIYEIKWDGYRAVAYLEGDEVEIISRNNKPFTGKYGPVTEALKELSVDAVLDGEIVAVDENGLANFQLLQNWQNAPVQLQFFIFDILWLDGYDLTGLTLIERKHILQQLLPKEHSILRFSDHIEKEGNKFYKSALKSGLEGIMAKKGDSIYTIGRRTEDWLKIKVNQRQEVIITGFTEPRKTRKCFGALLLGVYDGEELVYVGHTGSGFNTKSLEDIWKKLQPLITDKSPFKKQPKTNMPPTWVKPQLVCEIKFTEWTKDNMARHPIFMGLREDKFAKEVVMEKMKEGNAIVKKATSKKAKAEPSDDKAAIKKKAPLSGSKKSKTATRKIELSLEDGKEQEINLSGIDLHLSSLDKLYWKKEGYTKLDSINHYLRMAPYILPYLLDRPHSLNRHPNGIDAPNFFQKDMKGNLPEWMQTHEDFSESTNTTVNYLVCNNEASLIYMANLGCIEINPWHSRSQSWQQPDWCLLDLDPEGVGFDKVIECAQVIKKILDAIGAKGYCKTSGATGMHIYIPLGAQYDFEQSKQLAELICMMVMRELPEITSMERSPSKRKNKVYLDFLQNKETQTAAAPYSLRPKPGASVSTPLHWDEVKKGLTPTTYTIKNIYERVKAEGDLFKPVLGKGINMEKVIRKLGSILK